MIQSKQYNVFQDKKDNFGNNIKRRFDIKKKFENLNPADYYKGKMHPAGSNSGSNNNSSRGSDSRGTER